MLRVFCQTIQWQTYNEIITIILWAVENVLKVYGTTPERRLKTFPIKSWAVLVTKHSASCEHFWMSFDKGAYFIIEQWTPPPSPSHPIPSHPIPSRWILLSVSPGLGSGTGHIPAVLWWEVLRLRGMGGQSDPLCCVWVWDSLLGCRPFMWEPPPPPSHPALSSPQLQLQPSCDPAWEGSQHTHHSLF